MFKKNRLIMVAFLLINFLIWVPITVEADNYGGEIQTEGVVGFYEGDKSSSEPVDSEEPITSANPPAVKKPVGRYPSTGEIVKMGFKYVGLIILLLVIILFIWKRKKKRKDGRNHE